MTDPVTFYPETSPTWLGVITPIETPFEKKRRLEADFQKLELQRAQLKAYFDAKTEAIDNHELRLHDQIQQVNRELEEMGED
jgi:tripartite-type tricarboxylate transporter receptor subunit TctC